MRAATRREQKLLDALLAIAHGHGEDEFTLREIASRALAEMG